MATTPRGSEPGNYGEMGVGVATISYADVQKMMSPLVTVISELKHSIEAHRTALEALTARVDKLVPASPAIDLALGQTYKLLQESLAVAQNGTAVQQNGTATQTPRVDQSVSAR